MIESALVFALGLLTAGILALLVFPAFMRRAKRLAWREAEARLPRNMNEIAAARDAVRAVYAAKVARAEVEARESRNALLDERLARSETEAHLVAARSERNALATALTETEARLAHAHEVIRSREETLAQASADLREFERRAASEAGRLRSAERRIVELEGALERLRAEATDSGITADWTVDRIGTEPAALKSLPETEAPRREPLLIPPRPAETAPALSTVLKGLQIERSRLEHEARNLSAGRPASDGDSRTRRLSGLTMPSLSPPTGPHDEKPSEATASVLPLVAPAVQTTAVPSSQSVDADALVSPPRINELARRIRMGRERVAVAEDASEPRRKAVDPEG